MGVGKYSRSSAQASAGSDRHPKRKDYLKDNKEIVPGRAVGEGILEKAEKGEEQELVTVKRMWADSHLPWCHKGSHCIYLEEIPSLAQPIEAQGLALLISLFVYLFLFWSLGFMYPRLP